MNTTPTIKYALLSFFEAHKFTNLVQYYPTILEANPKDYSQELIDEITNFMTHELSNKIDFNSKKWTRLRLKFFQYQLSKSADDMITFLIEFRGLAYYIAPVSEKTKFNEKYLFALFTLYIVSENDVNIKNLINAYTAEYKITGKQIINAAMTFALTQIQQIAPDKLNDFFSATISIRDKDIAID